MKRIGAVITCILILISMVSASAVAIEDEGVLAIPEQAQSGLPLEELYDAYSHFEDVHTVEIPKSVVHLKEETFYGCTSLKNIRLHDKIQKIERDAFTETAYYNDPANWKDGCLYLGDALIKADPNAVPETVRIKDGTRIIADSAFKNCAGLTSITLPSTIEYVGKEVFAGTALLKNARYQTEHAVIVDHVLLSVNSEYSGAFSVPSEVTTIADEAFAHSKITALSASDSLRFIGTDALLDCSELTDIHLGKSVESLGRSPMAFCFSLKSITAHKDNPFFTVVDNVLYNRQITTVIRCPSKGICAVALPQSVTDISSSAFDGCFTLETVKLPKGLRVISSHAFSGCSDLTEITLPNTIEIIDENAFSGCSSLVSVVVPDHATFLGPFAFAYCSSLKSAVIGEGITELKYGLFLESNELASVTLGESIQSIEEAVFDSTRFMDEGFQDGMLIAGNYLIQVAADVEVCVVPENITLIATDAFEKPAKRNCLREVHVPTSIRQVNWLAFEGLPKTVSVFYDGSIRQFISNTIFDWDHINLYTTDLYTFIWTIVIFFVSFIALVLGMILANQKKAKKEADHE